MDLIVSIKTEYVTSSEAFEDIDDPNEIEEAYGGKYGRFTS